MEVMFYTKSLLEMKYIQPSEAHFGLNDNEIRTIERLSKGVTKTK